MSVLHGKGLTKSFGGVQALVDVDVSFEQGSIHGLIGPNGSGKSTLLSILSGAQVPDQGSIGIHDEWHAAFRSPRHARSLGIERMPQELALIPMMTVADNIALGSEPRRMGVCERRSLLKRVTTLLDDVGLHCEPDTLAGTLTPSEQRITMLARVLFRSSSFVFADEPTAGLQPDEAAHVTQAVTRAAERGLGVIFVSHHLDEVSRVCDQVTVLRDGRIAARFDSTTGREVLLNELLSAPIEAVDRNHSERNDAQVMRVTGLSAGGVRDLDLAVHANEVLGIAGLPGSGREHLLPAIIGELDRRNGDVRVGNQHVTSPRSGLRAGVGYMNGNRRRAIISTLDVGSHVSLPTIDTYAQAGLIDRRKERATVEKSLSDVAVKCTPQQSLRELSGGNQQRALLARWFTADVGILLIDEPAVGVDVGARASLLKQLRRFADRGAVIVASSDPEDLADICDRVICMRGGRIAAEIAYTNGWQRDIEATIL
ncbi:sugar ABC transporter ATP-binding protein [Rhodococcus opacus]|uniref:sugar ABC transporter ATP-binding protein n=1 Tax=Rhodococcus opacus TaxID=37919 RepID=UPI0024735B54|nr:sugar ABC transporter ATP-binding protein [Rhodococcus opacus]MDH6293409.1 ABC-type sugar transport system ATPase subunit [Rhodococcus opacus]